MTHESSAVGGDHFNRQNKSAITMKRETLQEILIIALLMGAVLCDLFAQSVRPLYRGINLEGPITGSAGWSWPPYSASYPPTLDPVLIAPSIVFVLFFLWAAQQWFAGMPIDINRLPSRRLGPAPHRIGYTSVESSPSRRVKRRQRRAHVVDWKLSEGQ